MICTVTKDKSARPGVAAFSLWARRATGGVGTGEDMANTVLTALVVAVGVAADLGAVSLLARVRPLRRKDRVRKAARVAWLLGFLAALLAVIPFTGYYVCALVAVPDDGYAAGWLLFFAGFIVLSVSTNRIKYRQDLERLEAEDDTAAAESAGADQ